MTSGRGARREPSILYVDDEKPNLDLFRRCFDDPYVIHTAASGPAALELLEQQPDIGVLVTDQRMEPMTGIELLAASEARWPLLTRMLLTAYSDRDLLMQAIQRGRVHDYVLKPWHADDVGMRLQAGLEKFKQRRAMATASAEKQAARDGDVMVGVEGGLREVDADLDRAARADSVVLIRGETGTGKELVARAVHQRSARARGPFIAVNCAALTSSLIESELFGVADKAATSTAARAGRFELADGGTLFLDEVGDVPLEFQVKLLRVLQEKEVQRVGATQGRKVNVRVIAATHQPLEAMVEDGSFRKDLYYRLNVVNIDVPPLRERPDDVAALARHFLDQLNCEMSRHVTLSDAAIDALRSHDWPGNVRELRNLMERAVVRADDDTLLGPEHFKLDVGRAPRASDPTPSGESPWAQLDREEQARIREALKQKLGNISEAAKLLGMKRTTLHDKIRKHQIR